MRKFVLSAIIFGVAIINLSAISNYILMCNGFEPSAINLALGGSPVGVVNVWHNDPCNAYDNPAYPSLQKGFSYSVTWYDFMKLKHPADDEKYTYSSGMMSFAYGGFGLLLPFVNHESLLGTRVDYGLITHTDENGNATGNTRLMFEEIFPIGLSVNLADLYRLVAPDYTLSDKKLDLCFGMNYIHNNSSIEPSRDVAKVTADNDLNSINSGALVKYNFPYSEKIFLESVVGVSMFNMFNEEIQFSDDQPHKIYKRLDTGIACAATRKNQNYKKDSKLINQFENLGCLRLLVGMNDERTESPNMYGIGTELGFLDTVFLRSGYHKDKGGNIEGLTFGIGLELHYQDLISFNGNYSFFPGGRQFKDKNVYNFSCHVGRRINLF